MLEPELRSLAEGLSRLKQRVLLKLSSHDLPGGTSAADPAAISPCARGRAPHTPRAGNLTFKDLKLSLNVKTVDWAPQCACAADLCSTPPRQSTDLTCLQIRHSWPSQREGVLHTGCVWLCFSAYC